jgi:hypothetical protein
MPTLQDRLTDFATRVATETKSNKLLINGNAATLSALTTTDKTHLVAAINEVRAAAVAAAAINDAATGSTTTWSSTKIDAEIDAAVAGLVASAPGALDTLDELAAALGDDASFATTTATALGNRLRVDTAAQGLSGTQQSNARTNLGLGTLATQSGTFSGTSSGTNTGDQTITLTGDVTGSGTGSFAATIATGAVTLAKMANMATASLIYRKTAGAGAPEVNTLATLKTDLGLTGTNSGDQTITLTGMVTGSGTGSFAASLGSFTKAQLSAAVSDGTVLYVGDVTSNATHTGDVTGATALTIANDAVTNAKAANMATATVKGRVTSGTGDPEDLTAAQVRTLLNVADGATANAGTVTSVSGTGTVSGVTLTGTVTGSGNLTLGGTLAITASQISNASTAGSAALTGGQPPTVGDIGVTDNTIVPGVYTYSTSSGSTGAPASVTRGQLRHYRRTSGAGGETQELVVEAGTGIASGAILSRSRVAGSWSAWLVAMTDADIGVPDTNFVAVFEAGL